eukprot:gene13178-27868_t
MLLTRTQQWRRIKSTKNRKKESELSSTPNEDTEILGIIRYGDQVRSKICKSCVTFVAEIRCVVIPSRSEYERIGIASDIWYSKLDLGLFKKSASLELRAYVTLFDIDIKTAMDRLYQNDCVSTEKARKCNSNTSLSEINLDVPSGKLNTIELLVSPESSDSTRESKCSVQWYVSSRSPRYCGTNPKTLIDDEDEGSRTYYIADSTNTSAIP